ncbi:MAG: hypothetical protein AB4290_21680 [Spirulina sp.]
MSESQTNQKKDYWDKADIVSKWLIPIIIVFVTIWFDSAQREREARQKTLEAAIAVLQAPQSDDTQELRAWALQTFKKLTEEASADLTPEAVDELKNTPLPTGSPPLDIPNPERLRVSIIRFEGSSDDKSEQIKSALIAGKYNNIRMTERRAPFPDNSEVRFYYPADSQNAKSLRDYIHNVLDFEIELNDRSLDDDATSHRPGDLHVYIR